jgi:predicted nucleic-acid-binding protein
MRAIDTNVLVRILTRDDPDQAADADAFIDRGAWVSVLALAEASWVLTSVYDFTAAELATAIRMLLDHAHLTLQDPDVVEAALQTFDATVTLASSTTRRAYQQGPRRHSGRQSRTAATPARVRLQMS